MIGEGRRIYERDGSERYRSWYAHQLVVVVVSGVKPRRHRILAHHNDDRLRATLDGPLRHQILDDLVDVLEQLAFTLGEALHFDRGLWFAEIDDHDVASFALGF